ncbi:MAG: site-2 protease family protein [Pirellulales bacterium]
MLIGEPAPTAYDLRFRLGSVPVRVHPFFWLFTMLMASHGGEAFALVAWVFVCFVSILIHEFGHALAMIRYGERPRIVLYAMGGLAISDGGGWARSKLVGGGGPRGWLSQVIISAAGPGAGFLLAGVVVIATLLAGGKILWNPPKLLVPIAVLENPRLMLVATELLWVNLLWGIINLVPVMPLDGGQIARSLLIARDPWRGSQQSIQLSILVAVAVATLAFVVWKQNYLGFLFGYLAVSNYLASQQRLW